MDHDQIDDNREPSQGVEPAAPGTMDERDETIAFLERIVAEQRKKLVAQGKAINESTFKLRVLEQGYSNQLADARLRADKAEQALAEERAKLASLGDGGEDALQLLTQAREEVNRVTAECNMLRARIAQGGGLRPTAAGDDSGSEAGEGTINSLIADISWAREPKDRSEHLRAQVSAEEESPSEEMIAPEIVFTNEDGDSDSGQS